jgi:hypothetical protein
MGVIVEDPYKLQVLAREQMKLKLLADILMDLKICQVEGWDRTQYINELKEVLDSFNCGRHKV